MTHGSIWLLAAALLLAGCSHKPPATPLARIEAAAADARRELRSLIADRDRADRADAIVAQLQALLAKSSADGQAAGRELEALDRSREATAAQFQALQSAADAAWQADLRRAVALRQELAKLLTAEEWKKSTDARRKLLELGITPQP
jgi:Skp family chaperone for outer membrane proteins